MELRDRVLEMIRIGSTPAEVVSELGIRRDQYYTALDELTADGVLAEFDRLPEGAVTETCPPQEATDLIAVAATNSAWSQRGTVAVRTLCARYGWTLPGTDRRYSRAQWTGHAVRRVDLEGFMVVGFVLPRHDNQRWHRAAPRHRAVCVESAPPCERYHTWIAERGRPVVHDDVDTNTGDLPLSLDELVSLTLAVAWVCEARAVLPDPQPDRSR